MIPMLPNKASVEPVLVRLKDIDIPVPALQKANPDINRFSAGFIILRENPVDLSNPHAFLIQRGFDGSWGGTWEGPGGGYEPGKDATIVETALRETQEEAGIVIPPEAIFPLVYRRTFEHKGLLMNYYIFIAQLDGEIPVTLSDEHLAWGFFNEQEARSFGTFDKEEARQQKHVMLESKKRTLCHIFRNKERLKNGDEKGIMHVDR
ncbi:hypothetical protein N7499_011041 [Penicillium canescens]|nr:hypothetical protein N7499_011041 [Penicillium canescens]KAJ6182796.1 hypothetical protein N7485_001438 [Penicillium canescens]